MGSVESIERASSAQSWLGRLNSEAGIHYLSEARAYQHAEDDYDAQYGLADQIDGIVGPLVLNALGKTPQALLEIGCGTGHFTASVVQDGRVPVVVASDGSPRFLEITGRKLQRLATASSVSLLCLSDNDFDKIPEGVFDAIAMRSVLHHFVDFRGVAAQLIGKLRPGGALCMLEPRADFHIITSVILKGASLRARALNRPWDESYDQMCQLYMDMTKYYCNRTLDKTLAEDKYAFHVEELAQIAERAGATLSCVGSEYPTPFSNQVRGFLNYCMNYDRDKVANILECVDEDLAFLDDVYAGRPQYAAAEWFIFRKP